MRIWITVGVMVLLLFGVVGIGYGQSDSCLKLLGNVDTTFQNPDSIMVDSCSSSPTYLHRFAKQWFTLYFQYGSILNIPAGSVETIIQVEWTQIDTGYPSVRAGFDTLEQTFGHFILNKNLPSEGDTSEVVDKSFSVRFDSLVDIDSAVRQLKLIPFLITDLVSYHNREGGFSGVNEFYTRRDDFSIQPNPCTSEMLISGGALKDINRYDIFSASGGLMRNGTFNISTPIVSTRELPPAIYFLKINGAQAGSFVVIH